MFKKFAIGFVFVLLLQGKTFAHDFYLSICQIEYNSENKSLEIAIKLTAHDLEYALEKSGAPHLNLGDKDLEPADADKYVEAYLRKNFKITINQKECEYTFLGKEVQLDDDIWLYVEVKSVDKINLLEINNALLADYFPRQQNHIHFKLANKKYSLVLMNGKFKGTIYERKKGDK